MRPLKLTLRGINSYRKEQTIDFAALTSAGLFGIFGPTGSGKSSILDAITLALYAKLPRSTKNFININEETAAVSFLFSITSTENHRYQVERTFRYHKGGTASTVRNTGATLAEITEEGTKVLADRPTEVTQECIRLLGLSSEDFMRTVVLPQGQFSEFLRLKNADRRSMLQRIFHLEQYGLELTQKIAGARQKQDLLLSNLEGQMQTFADLSPDTLREYKTAHARLLEEIKDITGQKERAAQAFQEADATRSLFLEYAPVKKAYEDSLAQMPAMEEKQKALDLGRQAAQVRPFYLQAQESAAQTAAAAAALNKAREEHRLAEMACQQAKKEADAASKDSLLRLPSLLKKEQDYDAARQRQETIRQWNARLSQAEITHRQTAASLAALKAQEKDCLTAGEQYQKEIAAKEEKAAGSRPSREEMHALEEGHVLEETYREKRSRYEEEKQQERAIRQQLEQEQKALTTLTEELYTWQQQIRHSQITLRQQEDRLVTQQKTQEEEMASLREQSTHLQNRHMALILRSQLKEGEVCPVCGGIHHGEESHPEDDARILAQIDAQKKREEALAAEAKEQEEQLHALRQKLSLSDMHLETISHLLPEQRDDDKTSSLPEHPASDPLRLQSLSTEYLSCRERCAQLAKQYARLRRQNEEQYNRLQQAVSEILALRKQWNTENFTTTLSLRQKQEKDYEKLQEELTRLRSLQEENRRRQETVAARILPLSGEAAAAEKELLHYRSLIQEEEQKLPEGCDMQTDFSALREEAVRQRTALEQRQKEWAEQYEEASLILQNKKDAMLQAGTRHELCRNNQQQAEETLQKQKALAGFSPEEDCQKSYLSPEELTGLEKELQDFHDSFARIKERLAYLEEKRQDQHISEEEWKAKKEQLEQISALLEQQQKKEAVLAGEVENCKKQLEQKKKLSKELDAALHRRGLIRQLEQLFKGNAFIEYVAESRLRYIAAEASVILSSISNGSYELEINDKAEFIIRDNKNGGVPRPCDTLSGGETFIASLSLALALSSAIQLNGTAPLELFFLDEGFGNLDDELLDVVMTSLERLRNTRRSIGIITHVEAIQARVPVKLVVTPSDLSQGGSTIRMEYS